MENIRQQLANIALQNIITLGGRRDLEAHENLKDDLITVSVWELDRVLLMAYELGKNSKE